MALLFILFCQIWNQLKGLFSKSVFFSLSLLPFFGTGSFKGMCKQIDHFPEDADYEADASEYFLREFTDTFTHTTVHSLKSSSSPKQYWRHFKNEINLLFCWFDVAVHIGVVSVTWKFSLAL